jgi:hypothetical protein
MSETQATHEPGTNGAHPPQAVAKETAYRAPHEASELLRSDAGDVNATTVTMDRSGAEQITSERVSLERSGAKSITTKSAQLERSGVLNLTSDNTVLHNSTATVVTTREARIVKSNILFFRADNAKVEGELKTLVHVGQACDNVKPVFDTQGALRFGAALGAMLLLGGRLLRLITGGR